MIMKTRNIFRYAALLYAAIAMVGVNSCDEPMPEPEPESPSFPELVENYEVAPGSTLTLSFTPNYNWELSVPSETFKYFWVIDGEFKAENLSGEASDAPVTVSIGVSDEEEFDNNRSCDVTLTMNGESKVIAKYMRPAKNRTMAVYAATVDTDGALKLGEDGTSYVYGTEEASSASLVWSAADGDFRLPVKVDANCEWTVTVPEWLNVAVPEKTTGVVELVFTGVSFEGVEGKVQFKVGDEVLKEITVKLPSCKGVDVYTATMTGGEFEYGESGDYVWSEDAVSEITLAWLGSDFRMPVKISSKCDWTLELPEWLAAKVVTEDGESNVPAETAGEIELVFKGVPSKYPLEDTEGKVKLVFDEKTLYELTVNIPGCKDIMTYSIGMSLTELEYNAMGWINTSTGFAEVDATASIYGTKDVKVFAVETTGDIVGAVPDWFEVKVSNFVTSAGADVLQEREVTFRIKENESMEERSAVVFFLPAGMSDKTSDMFNDDATVKKAYMDYSVNVHQRSSVYEEYLEVLSAEDETKYTFVDADESKKIELTDRFGETEHVYVLTYTAAFSKVWMNMAVPFTSYEVLAADGLNKTTDAEFWLQFVTNETNTNGAFTMYMYQELPEEASTGYVVFYDDNDDVLAIVECVSPVKEEVVNPDGDGYITDAEGNVYFETTSYFTNPDIAKSSGAKMYEYTAGPIYDQYSENGCPVLRLIYTDPSTVLSLNVPVTIFNYWVTPTEKNDKVVVDGKDIYTYAGYLWEWDDSQLIYVGPYDGTAEITMNFTESDFVILSLYESGKGIPSILIICELDLN